MRNGQSVAAMPFRNSLSAALGNLGFAGDKSCPLPDGGFNVLFIAGRSKDIHWLRYVNTELADNVARQAGGRGQLAADNRDQAGSAFAGVVVQNMSAGLI